MNIKNKNLKTNSGKWMVQKIPCVILKHKILRTDPSYKFVINADIYVKSNVAVRNDNEVYYYDLLNILAKSTNSVITGSQWLSLLEEKYNISLTQGENYNSNIFPDLSFDDIEDRDLFDRLYVELSPTQYSDGLNVFIDFSIQSSGGFVRNKLGLSTDLIRPEFLNALSFNLLSSITEKKPNGDFKIKNNFKTALELNNTEIEYIESLVSYTSTLCPKNNDNVPYFWHYLNQSSQLSLSGKQYLFGFILDKIILTSISNNDFSMDVDENNRPMNVIVKNGKYNTINQTIEINQPTI